MLYTGLDVHYTAKGTDVSHLVLVPNLDFRGRSFCGHFVVILRPVPLSLV